jgi:SAM-dependent methyltransferase
MLFEDRSRAESFGAIAALYDRFRPDYPPALVDALLQDGPRDVLDVGCGTGIAAALLMARGCAVLGVEVDARMAELARAKGIEVQVSAFEDSDAGGRRFDLVSSAQAWHRVKPRAGARKAASVLREGGRIALFWNLGGPPEDVRQRIAPIYARLEPELDEYSVVLGDRRQRGREALDGLRASGRFDAAEVLEFPWRQVYDTSSWLAFLATHSDHQALSPARRDRLLGAVGEAIDYLGGSFEMLYRTVLVSARRI